MTDSQSSARSLADEIMAQASPVNAAREATVTAAASRLQTLQHAYTCSAKETADYAAKLEELNGLINRSSTEEGALALGIHLGLITEGGCD
jgi:hypothetical protein